MYFSASTGSLPDIMRSTCKVKKKKRTLKIPYRGKYRIDRQRLHPTICIQDQPIKKMHKKERNTSVPMRSLLILAASASLTSSAAAAFFSSSSRVNPNLAPEIIMMNVTPNDKFMNKNTNEPS